MKQVTAYQTDDGKLHATEAEAAKHETWAVFLKCARDGGLEPRSFATLQYTFNLLYDRFEFVTRQEPPK